MQEIMTFFISYTHCCPNTTDALTFVTYPLCRIYSAICERILIFRFDGNYIYVYRFCVYFCGRVPHLFYAVWSR